MIRVEVKSRQDNLFDIWVYAANGEVLLHSSQGYEDAGDAEAVARLLWPPLPVPENVVFAPEFRGGSDIPPAYITAVADAIKAARDIVVLRVTYRDGATKTEQLR